VRRRLEAQKQLAAPIVIERAALACGATCEHASPYFSTWHRWYLHYFELICRKMSGHQEFVLPYWNYGSNNGPSSQLPAAFQQASPNPTMPNPLYFDDERMRLISYVERQLCGRKKGKLRASDIWLVKGRSSGGDPRHRRRVRYDADPLCQGARAVCASTEFMPLIAP
jgi:hypothetical protein